MLNVFDQKMKAIIPVVFCEFMLSCNHNILRYSIIHFDGFSEAKLCLNFNETMNTNKSTEVPTAAKQTLRALRLFS